MPILYFILAALCLLFPAQALVIAMALIAWNRWQRQRRRLPFRHL